MTTERRCGIYLPGHNVHYIQALKLAPHAESITGLVTIQDHDECLWFQPDNGDPRVGPFFHHAMPLIRAVVAESNGVAELLPKMSLLRVHRSKARALYYLSAKPLDDCHPGGLIDEEWLT